VKRRNQILHVAGLLVAGLLSMSTATVPAARAADDAVSTRIADYYRRKSNLPPDVSVSVTDIKDSTIPGAKSASLQLSRGGQSQNVEILMSPDGRYVVFGSVEDVTADPFAETMKKLKVDGSPTKGPKNAKVTIVEFSDFQCPYCARAHETMANEVLKQYGDKVRLVYKNFPLGFHKWAEPAAIAGMCIFDQNPDNFWKFYDYFFANQKDINETNVKDKALAALGDSKIDKDKFGKCFDEKKPLDRVKADMTEGQQVGVTGTPAFIINGRKISGAQPFQNFKAVIDDELQRAEKKG